VNKTYRSLTMVLLVAMVVGLTFLAPAPAPAQAPQTSTVVRLYFKDRDQLNAVSGELDIWEVDLDAGYAVAKVTPEQYKWLQGLGHELQVDAAKTEQLGIQAPLDPRFYYFDDYYQNSYGRYVKGFLQDTAYVYPDLTELYDVGNAWQAGHGGYARDIWALRITNEDPAYGDIASKPAFFLHAQVHAREVSTPELAIRYIRHLIQGYNGQGGYGVDADATWLVNHNVAYVMVMANPDGHYVNEQNTGAYRRKNMDNDDGCTDPNSWGVDLNRNHSFKWGCCGGSSEQPCAETYRGPARGSEPETQAFQTFFASVMLDQNGNNGDDELPSAAPENTTGTFLSLHSYADEILWPWGFTTSPAPNGAQLQTIGRKLAYYNGFDPTGFLYTVDGDTHDWTYGKFGIASYVFEVGSGYSGCGDFFPAYGCIDGIDGMPRNFWAENRPTFLYLHKTARTPYMTSYGPDTQNVSVNPSSVPQGTPTQLTANLADHRYGGDPLQPIAGAEYFVDAPGADGTGTAMAPVDGAWGGTNENGQATVDTSALSVGKHYILVHAKGNNGKWGPFTAVFVTITESQPQDKTHVSLIRTKVAAKTGKYNVTALIKIVDQNNALVPSATVSARWTLPNGSTVDKTGVTNANGAATVKTGAQTQTGNYQVCVTGVVKTGYLYDPASNVTTCQTQAVP